MINIVHLDIHCNDRRVITAIEIKLKSFKDDHDALSGQSLVATISVAFFKTTLLTDVGKSLEIKMNPKRKNIVDLMINLEKENDLTLEDVARFSDALQKAIDETKIA